MEDFPIFERICVTCYCPKRGNAAKRRRKKRCRDGDAKDCAAYALRRRRTGAT